MLNKILIIQNSLNPKISFCRDCSKSQRMSFLRMSLEPALAGQESDEYWILRCAHNDVSRVFLLLGHPLMQMRGKKLISFPYKLSLILLLISAILGLLSCSAELEEGPINQYGGAGRTNSYEVYGEFHTYNTYPDYPKPEYQDSAGVIAQPLVIASYKLILGTKNSKIKLLAGTNVHWEFDLDSNEYVAAGMCGDTRKNIYAVTTNHRLLSLDFTGKKRWEYEIKDSAVRERVYADLLAVEDGIVLGSSSGLLMKFSHDGKLQWKRQSPFDLNRVFAADEEGNIAAALTQNEFGKSDSLVFLNPDGKINWAKHLDSIRLINTPVIHEDRIFAAGVKEIGYARMSIIYAFDKKGNIQWTKELNNIPKYLSVDADGKLYVASYSSGIGEDMTGVFCFDQDAELIWKIYFEAGVPYPLMISEESIAFIGSDRKGVGVYFLNREGVLMKGLSMSDIPNIYLKPAVLPDGVIIFAGSEILCSVRIDDTALNKLIPF